MNASRAPIQGFPRTPTLVAVANAVEIANTSANAVMSYTPTGNVLIRATVSLTVTTATTTVTLSASWTDPNGGAQTYTWENVASVPIGVRLELPIVVAAQASQQVSVNVTAGTANQVYVTGALERLM